VRALPRAHPTTEAVPDYRDALLAVNDGALTR
jgi:hypothetical protein